MRTTKKSPAATRDDLRKLEGRLTKKFATKDDLKNYPTKQDLKKELEKYATKQDLREELKRYATKEDLNSQLDTKFASFKEEIFRYFDMKTEQLTHDYAGIFSDRTVQLQEKTIELDTRMVRVEKELHLDIAA